MWFLLEQRSGYSVGPPTTEGFLLFESIIDTGTVQAFRETEYRVHGDEPFTLKVGETCSALAAAHKRHRVECSAY